MRGDMWEKREKFGSFTGVGNEEDRIILVLVRILSGL
jgi:hypothetical protein